jgi:hypothetical protein
MAKWAIARRRNTEVAADTNIIIIIIITTSMTTPGPSADVTRCAKLLNNMSLVSLLTGRSTVACLLCGYSTLPRTVASRVCGILFVILFGGWRPALPACGFGLFNEASIWQTPAKL